MTRVVRAKPVVLCVLPTMRMLSLQASVTLLALAAQANLIAIGTLLKSSVETMSVDPAVGNSRMRMHLMNAACECGELHSADGLIIGARTSGPASECHAMPSGTASECWGAYIQVHPVPCHARRSSPSAIPCHAIPGVRVHPDDSRCHCSIQGLQGCI